MRQIETLHWRRISKAEAKRRFKNGEQVYLLPHRMNPENIWMSPFSTQGAQDFDKFCNAVVYYNCTSETGNYLSYYERKVS